MGELQQMSRRQEDSIFGRCIRHRAAIEHYFFLLLRDVGIHGPAYIKWRHASEYLINKYESYGDLGEGYE